MRVDEYQSIFRNFPLFLACIMLPFSSQVQNGEQCKTNLVTWVFVMGVVHFVHVVRSLVMLFFIIPRQNAKKLRRVINLGFSGTVILFEIIWLIYGNTFHYSQESLDCKERDTVRPLWILMMVELILGYIIYLSCGLIVGCVSIYFWFNTSNERWQARNLRREIAQARLRQ